jgi:hypothetical protein
VRLAYHTGVVFRSLLAERNACCGQRGKGNSNSNVNININNDETNNNKRKGKKEEDTSSRASEQNREKLGPHLTSQQRSSAAAD